MNNKYIDLMDRVLSAYSEEGIRAYINEVKSAGLTEHGFPRLGVNIGILIAYGRRPELHDAFIEIMDICCKEMPKTKEANDMGIWEVCLCLMLAEERKIVSEVFLNKWKKQLSEFDAWDRYTCVATAQNEPAGNFAMFSAVSEFVRGKYFEVDTLDFVDWQISSQLCKLDNLDMYKDKHPSNHMAYDMVVRTLMAFLLRLGYQGKYHQRIEQVLDNTADITLKMQSVTGEIPFGGRSNQFLHNNAALCAYCEMEAVRYKEKGDLKKAGEFKIAAKLSADDAMKYLSQNSISHIKNRYDVSSRIGCEGYAYFNKYMITAGSFFYMASRCCDESIEETELFNKKSGYVFSTSNDFHQIFLSAGGYFIQLDTKANFNADANGLGRVHKEGCSPVVCLSVPFSPHPKYAIEGINPTGLSICCYVENNENKLLSAESCSEYHLVESRSDSSAANAVFHVNLSDDIMVIQEYKVSEKGVEISLSGQEHMGFMLPVFDYDGKNSTIVSVEENMISTEYAGSVCRYRFNGKLSSEFTYYYNRNGRYRVYSVNSRSLHIEIEKI